jgi:hypothetical protein
MQQSCYRLWLRHGWGFRMELRTNVPKEGESERPLGTEQHRKDKGLEMSEETNREHMVLSIEEGHHSEFGTNALSADRIQI